MLRVTVGRVTFHVATHLTRDITLQALALWSSASVPVVGVFIVEQCCCSRTFSLHPHGEAVSLKCLLVLQVGLDVELSMEPVDGKSHTEEQIHSLGS